MTDETPEFPWSAPLAASDVPEDGLQTELVADPSVCAATARLAGLRDLSGLRAQFDVVPHGRGGLHVSGKVEATVGQTCVVTLEPVENRIDEPIDVVFVPAEALPTGASGHTAEDGEGPEPLVGGMIDLGAIATEFLLLAIDPYPRRPGAVFEPPAAGEAAAHPFAALAALKRQRDGDAE